MSFEDMWEGDALQFGDPRELNWTAVLFIGEKQE